MKRSFTLALFISFFLSISSQSATPTFAPQQGKETFEEIFSAIAQAKNYAYISVYSWSNYDFDKAMEKALENKVDVRVVLHPPLAKKESILKRVKKLELKGAHFKVSPINMHEKFVLVDDHFLMNTSANMSTSAEKNYSENFVFINSDDSSVEQKLYQDFANEFKILWNTAKDIVTHNEGLSPAIKMNIDNNIPRKEFQGHRSQAILYSSSMNFTLEKNKKTSKRFKQGRLFRLVRKGGKKNQTWTIRDKMIEAINAAEDNIYLSLNHFNIREISDALIKVIKNKGIKVFLTVDNQEYKAYINNKEMTPQFVKDWKKNFKTPPPVRVKYYSHAPSYRYWRLNHHKYMLVDYGTKQVKLFTGSYNLSKTAEHNQFDNMILFKGRDFENLYDAFYEEFMHLWSLNRDKNDNPDNSILSFFTTPKQGAYPLHNTKQAVSLTFSEIKALRRKVIKIAPGILQSLNKHRHCIAYKPKKQEYVGCPD